MARKKLKRADVTQRLTADLINMKRQIDNMLMTIEASLPEREDDGQGWMLRDPESGKIWREKEKPRRRKS